jgi:hypothetical protein
MTVPLDRLYEYIEIVATTCIYDNVLIYHFFPHGSKNMKNLTPTKKVDHLTMLTKPQVICNDQEPLNFDHFETDLSPTQKLWAKYNLPSVNFRGFPNVYDQCVLLHSEIGGNNIAKYQQQGNFVLAYYWSHAIIARDWFRFAEYLVPNKKVKKTFLIYNRAWSGTREYRLRFLEYLIETGLLDVCDIGFAPVDSESQIYYKDYTFRNPSWKPTTDFEPLVRKNHATSHSSADFDFDDYNNTHIEIVLETLFDDDRIHLTEKILRPIACGQPFMLASNAGSLEVLKKYGFKTFDSVWSEQYDQIEDPHARLQKIVSTMQDIDNWDAKTFADKMAVANEIANHNRQWFFSKEFFDRINKELAMNLSIALHTIKNNNTSQRYLDRCAVTDCTPELSLARAKAATPEEIQQVLNIAQQLNQTKQTK